MEAVVIQVKCDDERTIDVLGFGSIELRSESETNLLVDPLEEVFSWRLRDEPIYIAQRVLLISEPIVRRDDNVCITKELLDFSYSFPSCFSGRGNSTPYFDL